MSETEPLWQFSEQLDKRRKEILHCSGTFETIVERIVKRSIVTHFVVCRGKKGYLQNCLRPQFTIRLDTEIFDLFFNSPYGYRAQFLFDPNDGQKQNAILISMLSQKLMDYADGKKTKNHMGMDQIVTSLKCCSAKIWISENGFSFDHNFIEEILIPEWHASAVAAIAAYAKNHYPSPPEQEKAIWGVRAPLGHELEIKGAFLDDEGNETVPKSKIFRRYEIQKYGFA